MTKTNYHEECKKSDWSYIPNKFRTHFVSPFDQYARYIGKRFTVLGPDKESSKDLDDFEYTYKIRFKDGTEITAWGEEVCVADPDPPLYDYEIIGDSPDGCRPILKLHDGKFQVQPCDDNYWITVDSLEEVQEAYQHPEKFPNPWDTPMKSFSTSIIRCV